MSCIKCDEFQESEMTSYYRWKNANIEMRGCKEHLREVMETLTKVQKDQTKKVNTS